MTNLIPNTKIKNKIDIDLFGIVGIRLENPTDDDIKSLKKQLGVEPKDIKHEPDITIHFTPKLDTPDFTFLGLNSAGFTKDSFYLIGSEKPHKKIKIPFDKIGGKINIVCEHGIQSIPLLNHIVNFTFLGKGYLPLHSSALYFDEKGLLVMGWTKGGKTETLLSFANHGATYVGDEWVILSPGGDLMYGLPVPICIWEWQFPQIPQILPKMNAKKRIVFSGVHFLDFTHRFFCRIGMGKVASIKLLEEALPVFKRQLNIRVLPDIIFKDRIQKNGTPVNFILLAVSHDDEKILVAECESQEVADRMINSNECEQMPFFEFYNVFKFAFPDKKNEFLEDTKQIQYQLLNKALSNKRSYKVSHPYPVDFEELYNHIYRTVFKSEIYELDTLAEIRD
jgi:hypothetical protein